MKNKEHKAVWTYSARIGEVTQRELPEEEDQTFHASLLDNGTLTLKFHSKAGVLMSRISISLSTAMAVEAFTDSAQGDFFVLRVNGGQVPLLFPREEMTKFMNAVDQLEHNKVV